MDLIFLLGFIFPELGSARQRNRRGELLAERRLRVHPVYFLLPRLRGASWVYDSGGTLHYLRDVVRITLMDRGNVEIDRSRGIPICGKWRSIGTNWY